MLEIAGGKPDPSIPIDGVSLVPVLKGAARLNRDALYWHYPHFDIDAAEPGGVIRRGDYKLIEFYTDHRFELYDLKKDLGETTNLAQKMPEKAKELHRMLDDWRNSLGVKAEVRKPG
jgi:arylsulfatase A-like enzyme